MRQLAVRTRHGAETAVAALPDDVARAGWLDAQRGHLFPWLPVAFGTGIGIYFALGADPGPAGWTALALAVAAALALCLSGLCRAPVLIGLAAVGAGMLVAGHRTHLVAAPQLTWRYYGPVEGRVVELDRSASDAVRMTLDRVVLSDVPPGRTPARVRVSLHGRQGAHAPAPGETVILTAHLSPPPGPVEPGGYDFRRAAWFEGLGAVGYTRTPVLLYAPAGRGDPAMALYTLRMRIADGLRTRLPGDTGAVAAAITTGDRSGLGQEVTADLRASNLAHLLAISGLHMGLLTAVVFGGVRSALALWPRAALSWPVKKIAAGVALPVAAAYLALSGASVATERAFVMVSVMLVAVLLDRRALTLRAVALAALIVLALRPEALTGPGFQMSFAATTALVAVLGQARGVERRWPRWIAPVLAVALSSAVAGAATAPVAAAHFNVVSRYGLIANVLSVPVMGLVVAPGAVLAALLAPLGGADAGLWLMGAGIDWILAVAGTVAGWDGAVGRVPAPPAAVLPLLAMGGLWGMLWQGWARAAGVVPLAVALALWTGAERPAVLIADGGALVGVMGPDGRALSKERGDGFAASAWLENDGDAADQAAAFARPGIAAGPDGSVGWRIFRVEGVEGAILTGRGAADRVPAACARSAIVVLSTDWPEAPPPGCTLIDRSRLRATGALSLIPGADGTLAIRSVRETSGTRPWTAALLR